MPSLKNIRRRIQSVRQTQQITRAMRMVAAAKLRRAQDAILHARPYAERMQATLGEVARRSALAQHPLLEARERVRRLELVVVTSDRGLCGAFNANVLKRADAELRDRSAELEGVTLTLVGRKARDYYRRHGRATVSRSFTDLARVAYDHAVAVAQHVSARFLAGEVDEVALVHSEFLSAIGQRPRKVRLLPLSPDPDAAAGGDSAPYTVEPDPEQLLAILVPKALEVEIYRALLENQAGEHAARMTAMESATRNTEELIQSLTLQYNRARQAAITKELVEIVSGAEAL
jgi:F-type H+-transporting ATPase subunit gamma